MIVTTVTIWVKPEFNNQFIEATKKNQNESIKEPGNLRFDFLQCKDDPDQFLLYEAYENEESAKAHKQTPHYLKWRGKVADWMARPRQGIPHDVIAPKNSKEW